MKNILEKYNYAFDSEYIGKFLSNIEHNMEHWSITNIYMECLSFLDLTSTHSTDTCEKMLELAQKLEHYTIKYPDYPLPATLSVYPIFVNAIKKGMEKAPVKVAATVGGFPSSQTFSEIKYMECKMALEEGADELEVVFPLSPFFSGNVKEVVCEISEIKKIAGDKVLKVILETEALALPDNIASAAFLAMEAGADFIRTNTGKMKSAVTPMTAAIICQTIHAFYKKTGKKVGFKVDGGVVTAKDAACYYAIVETLLDKSWLVPDLFRLGSFQMANNLLSELEQKRVLFF
ncbi:MAG: deoxyribose-phosphate aldolase [Bacteroidales bacterium]